MKRLAVAIAVGVGLFWLYANYDDPSSPVPIVIGILALVAGVYRFARLIRRGGRTRQATPQQWTVAQAISRPLPAPSVAEAFARLPDYCAPQSRKDQA